MTRRSPNWLFDEVLLAAELGERYQWQHLRPNRPEVIDLSKLLRNANFYSEDQKPQNFRSPSSISRKIVDLYSNRPNYTGKATTRSDTDAKVLDYFAENPVAARQEAALIREPPRQGEEVPNSEKIDGQGELEGRKMHVRHYRRERSPKIREQKIDEVQKTGSPLECEACGFNYFEKYGERGRSFIEVHHKTPLYMLKREQKTRLSDLALVCANYHRMIHRGDLITVEELRSLLRHS